MSAGIREVVVGYDGSDRARAALETTRRLAPEGGTVSVVYAYRVPPEMKYYEFFEDVLAALRRDAQETAESARSEFEGADLEVRCEAIEGRAADVLAGVAQDRDADLIVMGSRGHGRLRSAVGSAVLDLLHGAPCPVLVVPAGDGPADPS